MLIHSGIIAVHPDVLGQNERIKSTHDNRYSQKIFFFLKGTVHSSNKWAKWFPDDLFIVSIFPKVPMGPVIFKLASFSGHSSRNYGD